MIRPLPPELSQKKVVEILHEDDGFLVRLECGHQSQWMVEPPVKTANCPQCVNLYVERLRKRRVVE